jgi:hypothetical protein
MQAIDKFRTDIGKAERRFAGKGENGLLEELRAFFYRSFPAVGEETLAALFAAYAERRRALPESASDWLAGVGSLLLMDYDGYPFEKADWEEIREAVALEEEEIDMELLEYVMSLVVEHGAL